MSVPPHLPYELISYFFGPKVVISLVTKSRNRSVDHFRGFETTGLVNAVLQTPTLGPES